ncbi:anti-sigma factor family protein [Pseudoxanthomonas beigongshangi]
MNRWSPTEEDLHAYIDGRLAAERHEAVRQWLREHPGDAARIEAWKHDAEALRAGWARDLEQAVPATLQPDRLRAGLRRRRRARLGLVASCLLALGVGGVAGWQWRDARLATEQLPMADAVAAYRLFAGDGGMAAGDIAPAALKTWMHTHFGAAGDVPDLSAQGFRLHAGRLLSTPEGAAAMLVYEDAEGARIGLYLRPRTPRNTTGERRDGRLLAQYWAEGDTAFALVGPATQGRMREIAPLLRGG